MYRNLVFFGKCFERGDVVCVFVGYKYSVDVVNANAERAKSGAKFFCTLSRIYEYCGAARLDIG